MATPAIDLIRSEVARKWPGTRFGITNCRPISGSTTWSQHAWSNAVDIWAPVSTLDHIDKFLRKNLSRLDIRVRLWRVRNHFFHIHVDTWPKGIGTPPCAGGTLRTLNKDGTRGDGFGDEDDMSEWTTMVQGKLNAAGFRDPDGKVLKIDGDLGPKTEHAYGEMTRAAAANIAEVPEHGHKPGSVVRG